VRLFYNGVTKLDEQIATLDLKTGGRSCRWIDGDWSNVDFGAFLNSKDWAHMTSR
jgi:hypothetical protein